MLPTLALGREGIRVYLIRHNLGVCLVTAGSYLISNDSLASESGMNDVFTASLKVSVVTFYVTKKLTFNISSKRMKADSVGVFSRATW